MTSHPLGTTSFWGVIKWKTSTDEDLNVPMELRGWVSSPRRGRVVVHKDLAGKPLSQRAYSMFSLSVNPASDYQAFFSCRTRGFLFIVVHGLLIVVVSLVVEHWLWALRLSNCGTWALLLHSVWNLPRPGLEPVSPALVCRFLYSLTCAIVNSIMSNQCTYPNLKIILLGEWCL